MREPGRRRSPVGPTLAEMPEERGRSLSNELAAYSVRAVAVRCRVAKVGHELVDPAPVGSNGQRRDSLVTAW